MARNVLGHFGEILYLILVLLGTVTTVCAEIIAISSIFVYDIYKTYIYVRTEILHTIFILRRMNMEIVSRFCSSLSSTTLNRRTVCCVVSVALMCAILVCGVTAPALSSAHLVHPMTSTCILEYNSISKFQNLQAFSGRNNISCFSEK